MSNLHKDLSDIQLHVPKGFSNASNGTKLTKNATGALEWATDSGGGGGVTQIVAGTDISITPTGGTGAVTINSTATGGVSQIIAGNNVTISPTGGTGNVTINATIPSTTDKVTETTKGYITQGTRPISNWFLQSITSGANFSFDTRQTATSINLTNPSDGIGASFMGAVRVGNIGSFRGIATATANTNCTMSLFLMRPDCTNGLLRTAIQIGTINLTLTAGSAVCFALPISTGAVQNGDQLCVGLKTNATGTTSFTGTLEISY
tara:strand:+ start:2164 stop:2952 length:789 start_codon:yes stop_codon:yes gene_type:complete